MNYSTQAQSDLLRIATGLANLHSDGNSSRVVCAIAEGLRQAIKFQLPEGGRYFGTSELDNSAFDYLKLPYPVVVLEADVSMYGDGRMIREGIFKEVIATRRIVLCWESDSSFSLVPDQESALVAEWGPGVFFQVVFYGDADKFWTTNAVGAFLPRRNSVDKVVLEPGSWLHQVEQQRSHGNGVPDFAQAIILRPTVVLPEFYRQIEQELGFEPAKVRAFMDNQDEFVMLLQFCIMLSCQNVTSRTHVQTTQAKNDKRIRNGKLPLYEYKILELKSAAGESGPGQSGFEHNSPRCHLRRGHIRRLGPERRIWVRAAVVGNPHRGVIEKDYDAQYLL